MAATTSAAANSQGTTLLGKSELLQWACQFSGVPQCTRYDDLKDGMVFVALAERLWPALIDAAFVASQRRGVRNARKNWETLRQLMHTIGLPIHLCDQKGVAAGHQRPCYNLLVMFYFLSRLAVSSDFSVDFAHPIDEALAAFLQSPASIQCLQTPSTTALTAVSTSATSSANATPNKAVGGIGGASRANALVMSTAQGHHAAATAVVHPAAVGGAATLNHRGMNPVRHGVRQDEESPQADFDRGVGRSVSPSHPAPSPRKTTAPVPTTPRLDMAYQASGTAAISDAATVAQLRSELSHSRKARELLELELSHVKQLSRHVLEQQRSLFEAEMQRVVGQSQAQLATTRLEMEFEMQQALLALRGDYERVLDDVALQQNVQRGGGLNGSHEVHSLRQSIALHIGKLQATEAALKRAETLNQQLKESLDVQRAKLEATSTTILGACLKDYEAVRHWIQRRVAATEDSSNDGCDDNAAELGSIASGCWERISRLTPLDRAPFVSLLKRLTLECDVQRATAERVKAENSAAPSDERKAASSASYHHGGGQMPTGASASAAANSSDGSDEARILRQHVDRLNTANSLLHEQLKLLRRNGDGPVGLILNKSGDHEEPGVIGLQGFEALAHHSLASLRHVLSSQSIVGSEAAEQIEDIFWALTTATQVFGSRAVASHRAAVSMQRALEDANRDIIVARHEAESAVAEARDAAEARWRPAEAGLKRTLMRLEMELRVAQSDAGRVKSESEALLSRVKDMIGALLGELRRSGGAEDADVVQHVQEELQMYLQAWYQDVHRKRDADGDAGVHPQEQLLEYRGELEALRVELESTREAYQRQSALAESRRRDLEAVQSAAVAAENLLQSMQSSVKDFFSQFFHVISRHVSAGAMPSSSAEQRSLNHQRGVSLRSLEDVANHFSSNAVSNRQVVPPLEGLRPRVAAPSVAAAVERGVPPGANHMESAVVATWDEVGNRTTSPSQLLSDQQGSQQVRPALTADSAASTASVSASLLMTPEELERRKQAILAKYGAKGPAPPSSSR